MRVMSSFDRMPQTDSTDGCCALIAIKGRAHCKSRLDKRLSAPARIELVRAMLAHVLGAAQAAATVRQVIVLSPERDTLPADVPVLADAGAGLNAALGHAQHALLELGISELLVLPADLPAVTPLEIDRLVRAGRSGGFSIAPDAADHGTNALYVHSARAFRFQFGANSKALHLRESDRLGLQAQIVRLPGLEFDLDVPDDLDRIRYLQRIPCLQP
jgi:2-phospho-L-lactate/phosphoenolpyruvate guanylyltransferase